MQSHEKSWRSVFIPKVDACQCSTQRNSCSLSPALFRGVVILSNRRVKKRRSLTEYVRAARKWR